MIIEIIARAVVLIVVVYALWHDDNNWKVACLTVIAVAALTVHGIANHHEGYKDGLDDGQCLMAKVIDAKPSITIHNMEDYCK